MNRLYAVGLSKFSKQDPAISMIFAQSANGVIGDAGGLPWHLPSDLKRFKEITLGQPVIMGRTTFDHFEEPLPERHNIVLSRTLDLNTYDHYENVSPAISPRVALDLAMANLELARPEIFIIGGAQTYGAFMPYINRIYRTTIAEHCEGDTFMPDFDGDWEELLVLNNYDDEIINTFDILERV